MRLQEILDEWREDCKLDALRLQEEAARVPTLHEKYGRMLAVERSRLRELRVRAKRLRLEKYEFLVNPTHDKFKEGWTVPSRGGKMYKGEAELYLDGDPDLLDLEMRAQAQDEKVEQLKSILQSVNQRTWIIKDIIEHRKFEAGA